MLLLSAKTQADEARRWKLVALASLALLIGYVAGQLTPSASAQQGVTKVQLDTSNCTVSYTRTLVLPTGAIPTAFHAGEGALFYAICG